MPTPCWPQECGGGLRPRRRRQRTQRASGLVEQHVRTGGVCADHVVRVCRRVECGGGWEELQGNNYIAMWQRDLVFDKALFRKHWKRGTGCP